jgi:hypothetical protein
VAKFLVFPPPGNVHWRHFDASEDRSTCPFSPYFSIVKTKIKADRQRETHIEKRARDRA